LGVVTLFGGFCFLVFWFLSYLHIAYFILNIFLSLFLYFWFFWVGLGENIKLMKDDK